MRARAALTLTAIVSSILGALAVYLVLSVPNDLRADALLKQARKEVTAGETEKARSSLSRIVQQYPRTDAAAAAMVALMSLSQRERDEMTRAITLLRRQNEEQSKAIVLLQRGVTDLRNAPPKVVQAPPAPAPTVTKPVVKAPVKKTTTKKKPAKQTRRRR